MKRVVGVLGKRYWPALVIAAIVFAVLAWLLGPRPAWARYLPTPAVAGWPDQVFLSPSGRYLVLGEFEGCTVFDLSDSQPLLSFPLRNRCVCGFRADDSLVWYDGSSPVKFFAWRPGHAGAQELAQRISYPAGLPYSMTILFSKFSGMAPFFQIWPVTCLLSPDAKWWLVTVLKEDQVHFELVDSLSGETVSKLEMPSIQLKDHSAEILHAAFSADSTTVVSKLGEQMQWFDVPGGRLLRSSMASGSPPPGVALGSASLVTRDRMVALVQVSAEKPEQGARLLMCDAQGSWRSLAMPETGWSDSQQRTTLQLAARADEAAGLLIYVWRYETTGSGRVYRQPGYRWGARHLTTGELLCAGRVAEVDVDYDRVSNGGLLTVLPGGVAVLEKPLQLAEEAVPPEKPTWWEWCREQVFEWLPQLRPSLRTDLLFVEARTGRPSGTLSVNMGRASCVLSSDAKSLHVVGVEGTRWVDRVYDYPVRKPWLLITGSAGVVAVVTALLLESLRLIRFVVGRWRRTTASVS